MQFIDQTVILGVDNDKQFVYPLEQREELRPIMQKPILNDIVRPNEVSKIKSVIQDMDAVIIYGASIGETDALWWKTISEWLLRDTGHRVSIVGYIYDSNPASATAQAKIKVYEDRFRKSMHSQYRGKERKNMIESYKCEEWMFKFLPSVVNVKSKGIFDSLVADS